MHILLCWIKSSKEHGIAIVVTRKLAKKPLVGDLGLGKNLGVKIKLVALNDVLGRNVETHGRELVLAEVVKNEKNSCRIAFEKSERS